MQGAYETQKQPWRRGQNSAKSDNLSTTSNTVAVEGLAEISVVVGVGREVSRAVLGRLLAPPQVVLLANRSSRALSCSCRMSQLG
jgi:type IV secretory pathway protease TraF